MISTTQRTSRCGLCHTDRSDDETRPEDISVLCTLPRQSVHTQPAGRDFWLADSPLIKSPWTLLSCIIRKVMYLLYQIIPKLYSCSLKTKSLPAQCSACVQSVNKRSILRSMCIGYGQKINYDCEIERAEMARQVGNEHNWEATEEYKSQGTWH